MLKMPRDIVATIEELEATRDFDNPQYKIAIDRFYELHVCRVLPWPETVIRSFEGTNVAMYRQMWGPSEFTASGTLKDWSVVEMLPSIGHRTLIISGEYDEAQPVAQEILRAGIKDSRWEMLADCSHFCHIENPKQYARLVTDFLDGATS